MRILYPTHHPSIDSHIEQRMIYDILRRNYYWPCMAKDMYTMIAQCATCVQNRIQQRHKQRLQLFPESGLHDFLAMNILGLLSETQQEIQYVAIVTDSYSKLTRAVPKTKKSSTHMASIFLDHWIIQFGTRKNFLTDKGSQFVNKFIVAICSYRGVKHQITTAYNPETNENAKQYNSTIDTRLEHNVIDRQRDWEVCVQPLRYAYDMQFHRTTYTPPCSHKMRRNPLGPSLVRVKSSTNGDPTLAKIPQKCATLLEPASLRYGHSRYANGKIIRTVQTQLRSQ